MFFYQLYIVEGKLKLFLSKYTKSYLAPCTITTTTTKMNNNIVCDDGPDKAWCDQYGCGGELQELKDGTMICLACGYAYLPNSVTKHKRNLQPIESQYDEI